MLPEQPRQHPQHQLLGAVQPLSLQEIQQVTAQPPVSKKKLLSMQQAQLALKNAQVLLCWQLVGVNDLFKN